jgi:DNA-binding MarR family transcriptional regulator
MDLEQFFPYRLARAAETVSQALALIYNERFELTRDEWRVLAALAELREAKTTRVLESTSLDKMRVSRAVARLERDGLITRTADPDDGRGHLLRLRPAGRTLYARIVPMAQAREAYLLEPLSVAERKLFLRALTLVQERAEQLARQG